MATSDYPLQVDNHTELTDGVDVIQANDQNLSYASVDAIETFVGVTGKAATWSTDVLDIMLNFSPPLITKASASTLSVSAGALLIGNSGQTQRLLRRNTSAIIISASDIDTGTIANNTYYYIYAVADASSTNFTVKFSLSATTPTGLTNYELIGWFYNQAAGSLDITLDYSGNVKRNGRDVPNVVHRVGTTEDAVNDTSYGSDLTETVIRIYTSGRPVLMLFKARVNDSATLFIVDIDGSDKTNSEVKQSINISWSPDDTESTLHYIEDLAAGEHVITIQAKVEVVTSNIDTKNLTVVEL